MGNWPGICYRRELEASKRMPRWFQLSTPVDETSKMIDDDIVSYINIELRGPVSYQWLPNPP